MALASLALIAFALRLLPVFVFPSIDYPDEIFQTIEQAHRLAFGYGVVPWEFEYGSRSWMLPGALAGLIELSRPFGEGPGVYLPFVGAALAALSSAAALCGALWGRRFFGLTGMAVAGLAAAVSIDAVYFGPRTLSEAVAAHLLVVGLYLAEPGDAAPGRLRLVLGGLLLGLAATTRIQLAPAILAIAAWPSAAAYRRRLPPLLGGAAIAVLASGALDAATWGSPFVSTWRNFAVNFFDGAAAANGVAPWHGYGDMLMDAWGAGGVFAVLLLALIGARRLPHLVVAAAVILASHSLIGHKEYRFIYPAILLLVLSSGLGLAQLTAWAIEALARQRPGARWSGFVCGAMALGFPVLVSLGESTSPAYRELWTRGHAALRGADFIARLPSVCGIGSFGLHWTQSAGYAHFHHRVPTYWPENDERLFRKTKPAFNVLLYSRRPAWAKEFVDASCVDGVCVAIRRGHCVAMPTRPSEPGPTVGGISP
ncbi:MAG: hypothetical protein ABR929_11590 [Roseiarcus sp.]|jgi:hypothetical protein